MHSRAFSRPGSDLVFLGLIALASSLAAVALQNLPTRFALAAAAALLLGFAWLLIKDKRHSLVALMIFLMPVNMNKRFFKVPAVFPEVEALSVDLTDVALAVLYLLWILDCLRNKTYHFRTDGFLYFMLALFGMGVLSLANAVRPDIGIIYLLKILKLFLFYFYLINHLDRIQTVKIVLAALGASIFIECLVAGLQLAFGETLNLTYFGGTTIGNTAFAESKALRRVGGTLGHANLLGFYLETLLPLMLAMTFVSSWRRWRWFFGCAFAAGSALLFLTFSRGAWLVSGLSLGVLLIVLAARNFKRRIMIRETAALLLLAAAAAAVLSGKIASRLTSHDSGSAQTRVFQFQVAQNIISAHPWLGVGINNYAETMSAYDETPERIARTFPFPVHNVYLDFWAETGTLGLVLLLLFLASVLGKSLTGFRAARDELPKYALLGLGLGLAANYLHCLVDMHYILNNRYFYLFAALISQLCLLNRRALPEKEARP